MTNPFKRTVSLDEIHTYVADITTMTNLRSYLSRPQIDQYNRNLDVMQKVLERLLERLL